MPNLYYREFRAIVFFTLSMCGYVSHAREVEEKARMQQQSISATPPEILAATAPDYTTPAGRSRECLGRLVFDVAHESDWPTHYDGRGKDLPGLAFSEKVRPRGDGILFGNTRVKIYGPLTLKQLESIQRKTPSGKVRFLSDLIKRAQSEINLLGKGENSGQGSEKRVASLKSDVEMWLRRIKELETEFREFAPGLPDSEGYASDMTFGNGESATHSVYWAHMVRGQFIFIFESTQKWDAKVDKVMHKEQFIAMLNKFRFREPNEIPADLGICIPHGFIADDGKTVSEIHEAFRYRDAPGVLYTLHIGTVDERGAKETWLTALATAAAANVISAEGKSANAVVTARVGPRSYSIGGLKGSQGGFAIKVNPLGKEPFESYTVYTGYSGWLGTDALPYILTEMTSRNNTQAPELTQNPPPFKGSMDRLEMLLKSIRLRPTSPMMPDLVRLPVAIRERVPRP